MTDPTKADDDSTDEQPDGTRPETALDLYLDTRETEVTTNTLQAHTYRLNHFVEWCEMREIETMEELDGKDLHEFRLWRREDGDLNIVSLHTQLSTLRVFLKFCQSIEIVDNNLYEKLMIPTLDSGQDQRDSIVPTDHAQKTLAWLDKYEYASVGHTIFLLLWRTGMRVGTLQSIDVDDYNRAHARLSVAHRPQGGTTLKMGEDGERVIALSSETCMVLNDYLDHARHDVCDEYGREPFIVVGTTRPSKSTLRRHVHRVLQPCTWTNDCPHDRTMNECPSVGYAEDVSCPSSVPPHDVRRGAITHALSEDVPKQVVSDRMNVKERVLDEHYDQRTPETKAEQRRDYLDRF
jgi:site-specific recombinase XerD